MRAPNRWDDALLAGATSWATLAPMATLLVDARWVVPAFVVSAVVIVTGIVARGYFRHWAPVLALQLVAGLESIVLIHGRGHTSYGLPTWETVVALNNVLVEARETILRYSAPAPTNRGMIVALSFLALAVILAVDLLAATWQAPAAAGLALLTAYLITAANSGEPLFFAYFVIPAALWLAMLARSGTARLRRWATVLPKTPSGQAPPADPRTAFARGASVLGVGALLLAVLLPALVPHLPTRYLGDGLGRSNRTAGGGTFSLSTTLDLLGNLESNSARPALRYRTNVANPGPLRVAVLVDYNATGEFRQRQQYPATQIGPGQPLQSVDGLVNWWGPVRDQLPPGSIRTGTLTAYDAKLDQPQIALPYGAQYLRVDGAGQAVEFREGTVEVFDSTSSYEVDFAAIDPSPRLLQESPPWSSNPVGFLSDTVTPDTLEVDPRAATLLSETMASIAGEAQTDLERAVAIQDWLRSPAFTYDLTLAPVVEQDGVAPDAITHFLRTRQGYCQQFATAMIMLARSSGIPARMAIGFLPGRVSRGEWTVLQSDAHAWPELYFAPYGWVRFDPTPGSRSGAAPTYARVPTVTPSSSSTTVTARPTGAATRPQDQLDPQDLQPSTQTSWQRVRAMSRWAWVGVGVGAGVLAALVLPVTSLLARRRRLAQREDDAAVIEARWQDLIARLGDLGIATPGTLTPRQVHGHLADTAVLDNATAAALGRVVGVLELARYAPPGEELADPSRDIAAIYASVDASRSPRVRLRARLLPYAGRAALLSAGRALAALPARLADEVRHRGDT